MAGLLFGTGGIPRSAKSSATISGIERIAELGLGCMEVEFVQGVKMGETGARQVAEVAARTGVSLSAHAPYFINLNAHEAEKVKASQERLLQAARIASLCGARSVVFHAAFYLGDPPGAVYTRVKQYLEEVMRQLRQENNPVWIRPEVTGKGAQFGTIEEVLKLCTEIERVAPCIDFAHWHARSVMADSYQEFASVLRQIEERLGKAALSDIHLHVSGISYGRKGEIKHLNLKESDLKYVELLRALRDCEAEGLVICESPNLEADARLMSETYDALVKAG